MRKMLHVDGCNYNSGTIILYFEYKSFNRNGNLKYELNKTKLIFYQNTTVLN